MVNNIYSSPFVNNIFIFSRKVSSVETIGPLNQIWNDFHSHFHPRSQPDWKQKKSIRLQKRNHQQTYSFPPPPSSFQQSQNASKTDALIGWSHLPNNKIREILVNESVSSPACIVSVDRDTIDNNRD